MVNIVSVLPREFNRQVEVETSDWEVEKEMAKHRPVCYFVMDNGATEEQNGFFEPPTEAMKNHLEPLFIRAKLEETTVNKILVDCGATINIIPHFMLRKIGKSDENIKPHNMVLSNYEGGIGTTMGVIQLDIKVGSILRPTMFMVISAKPNYNLLLGREWIHGVGAVPSSMHQRLLLWRPVGMVENIEADQSYYLGEVNHLGLADFDKNLAHIGPCPTPDFDLAPAPNTFCSLYLHPEHGFQWDREDLSHIDFSGLTDIQPTGWGSEFSDND